MSPASGRARRRPKRSRLLTNPDRIGAAYERELLRYLAPLRGLTATFLVRDLPKVLAAAPEAFRADEKKTFAEVLRRLVDGLAERFEKASPDAKASKAASAAVRGAERHNARELARTLAIDPFRGEAWLEAYVADATRANVALIKSIPASYFADLERVIGDGVRGGLRHEEIAKVILARFADKTRPDLWVKAKSRATLIARDQVAKFNSELNRIRQTNLGLTRYTWSTSKDERVRPEHRRREGKVFTWADPPADGHPGIPVRCRCVAQPIVDDLLP